MARYKPKSIESYQKDREIYLASSAAMSSDPFISKFAKGVKVTDRNNRVFTDYCLGGGRLILGHAHRNVVLGTKKIAEKGILFDTITSEEINFAKQLVRQVPSIEKVCFASSYSEILNKAVEIARAYTQKKYVLTFDLCCCAQRLKGSTIIASFNQPLSLEKKVSQHKDNIACIVVETVTSQCGIVPVSKDFLKELRSFAQKNKIPLVLDEQLTGFRTSPQGTQADFSINPDLICLSGIMGGGFPLAALGFSKKFEEKESLQKPAQRFSPYLSPVMLRAGLATMKVLSKEHYFSLKKKSQSFVDEINAFFQENAISAQVTAYDSMMSLFFSSDPIKDKKSAQKGLSCETYQRLREYLLSEGILFPQDQSIPFFITLMHSRKDLHKLLTSLKNFFRVSP